MQEEAKDIKKATLVAGGTDKRDNKVKKPSVCELDMHVCMFPNMLSAMQLGSHIKDRHPSSQALPSFLSLAVCVGGKPGKEAKRMLSSNLNARVWEVLIR